MAKPTCNAPDCDSETSGLWCGIHDGPRDSAIDRDGYRYFHAMNHPLASGKNGRLLWHRFVLWEHLGRPRSAECHWCGRYLEWKTGYRVERVTVDHLDADKLHNKPENLVSACDECNRQRTSSKGLRLELEWQPVGRVQGARWRKLQQEVLAEHPICQSAGCKNPASDVDHIVARRFGGDVWDRANLQALCKPCHGRKTSRENRRR